MFMEFEGFSVIYSADILRDISVSRYKPKSKKWVLTENNWEDSGEEKVKHRKWCAWLSPEEFESWVEDLDFYAEDIETMGSLGGVMPDGKFVFCLQPAISFVSDLCYEGAYLRAYVTPYPKRSDTPLLPEEEERFFDEEDWQKVRREIFDKYGRE
jgi:hypothetical protein